MAQCSFIRHSVVETETRKLIDMTTRHASPKSLRSFILHYEVSKLAFESLPPLICFPIISD
jgi:hypothetical protein